MAKKEVKEKPTEEVKEKPAEEVKKVSTEEAKEKPAEEVKERPKEEKRNREFYWVLGVMAGLVVLFIAAFTIFQSLNNFEYEGLTFKEGNLGEIPFYTYTYSSIITPNVISDVRTINLVLRGDPRENNVPVEGELEFPYGKTVYITVDSPGIVECDYSLLAVQSLRSFLAGGGLTYQGATVNETEAEENDLTYATCEDFPFNPVIVIQSGEETKITRTEDRCYVMEVANCEILPAIEKLIVQSLLDARARAGL